MRAKKLRFGVIGYIALFLLAGILVFYLCKATNQSMPSIVVETEFVGEYSLGGSDWKPYDKDTKLSSFEGDLVLRGGFRESFPGVVSFYLNHIGVSISVNGEEVFYSGRVRDDIPEMMCGSNWSGWCYDVENPEDILEIRLHNPHSYGNADAYNEFLDSLCFGGGETLERHLKPEGLPYRIAGICIMVVSIALLGMALGYTAQRLPSAGLLWSMGAMALFMGGYILLDTRDIEFKSELIIFNTCMRQICIMFAALELGGCIRKILTGRAGRIASYAVAVLGVYDGILLLLSLINQVSIYDSGLYWAALQGIVCLVLLGCCICEYRRSDRENRVMLVSCVILLSVVLLELVNARVNLWTSGIVVKLAFLLLFVFHLVRAVKIVAANHRESARAKELAKEVKNNRIILAMSQIRMHFVFNVLTAISGLCESDPVRADESIIHFARYLRGNMDVIQKDEPIPFSKALAHLENYIALEQLRFGDKIKFEKNLEVTDFEIPPLVLQPLAENAIKHGLLPKLSGGTIRLETKQQGSNVIVAVIDDGVGFDTKSLKEEESVGLSNVRFRIAQMMSGRLELESSPEQGTKAILIIPCP